MSININNIRSNLDYPLVKFSSNEQDWWTIRDAVRGIQIFGGIGSGKSSGSGKTFAKAFLKNGFGGLVLCAKPDERANWEKLAADMGRSDDLVVFSENSSYQFNPLQYELTRKGKGAGEVFNLSYLFMEIYKMGNRFSGSGGGGESERYWDTALKRCINRMIQILKFADEKVSIENMIKILTSAPYEEELAAFYDLNEPQKRDYIEKNFCLSALSKAEINCMDTLVEDEFLFVANYFYSEFSRLDEKTRSIVSESFLGLAEPFTSGILKRHFSKSTNLNPEITFEGKIIILDFPVKEYLASGVYAQGIYKLLWQQAAERRDPNHDLLPVFLWVDESQLFLSDYDQIFQTTARSAKACTVFISQNISNYYSAIGGSNPKPKVDSLLGNLGTKIFHANNDAVTNKWASDTIGTDIINLSGINVGQQNHSSSLNQHILNQVQPREFTILLSGGEYNEFKVEGIVTVSGRKWSNDKNYCKVIFNQKN